MANVIPPTLHTGIKFAMMFIIIALQCPALKGYSTVALGLY